MACRTCDHTMKCIVSTFDLMIYWCMRCGTLKHQRRYENCIDWDIPFDAMKRRGEPFHQIHKEKGGGQTHYEPM